MESGKPATSEISSEEIDQSDEIIEETSTKRSYKCTYCKRGFTNAQALGGHMNIHRKDRAKDKHVSNNSNSNKSNETSIASRSYVKTMSSQAEKYYPVFEAQRNYNMYFHPSNPRPLHACHETENHGPKLQTLNMKDEIFAANLSLQIGASRGDDKEMKREVEKVDGVDLELRLGHNP